MAKKVIEEKEVDVPEVYMDEISEQESINNEEIVSEEKPLKTSAKLAPEVPAMEIRVNKTAAKLVEIHTIEPVDATIAGNRYVFRKDTDHKVPSDVAAILSNSKKAYRK